MTIFSLDPMHLSGRRFRWLGGLTGKPLHAAVSDLPIGAYVLAAVFDILSAFVGGAGGHHLSLAAAYLTSAGLIISAVAALTGLWDWVTVVPTRSKAWRVANTHMLIMVGATLLAVVDRVMRSETGNGGSPTSVIVVSVIVAILVTIGATFGGSLVFDHGIRVERSQD